MKIVGIILLVLQAVGLLGGLIGQSIPTSLPGLIGYFSFGIVKGVQHCGFQS